jgi:hypothetical protein
VLLAIRPSAASVLFAVAAAAAFAAHEPLLVVLGERGTRARREDGVRARHRLTLAVLGSAALGLGALVLSPTARPWVALPGVLAVIALVFILRRTERTLAGQLVASATLTAAALPTAVASGVGWRLAGAVCAVFYATSVLSTVEVRTIARRGASNLSRLGAWVVSSAALTALAIWQPRLALSALPTVLAVIAIVTIRPEPSRLRQLGWMLATASLITATTVVIALRSIL